MTFQPYDLIGDIHGYSGPLNALLQKLGYRKHGAGYHHPERKAIFLGDFVDRGPGQREVVNTVRAMVEAGDALAVMGNHEFNAIAYATAHSDTGAWLRPHIEKNDKQHAAFLAAYPFGSNEHIDAINWFKTLPMWLDLGEVRAVHACWDKTIIERLGSPMLSTSLLVAASQKGTFEHHAIETVLKGKEVKLRNGQSILDGGGTPRHDIRVRWWDRGATTYRQAFMGPESARTHIPNDDIAGDHLLDYSHDEVPVFVGHYWLDGRPRPLAANIACLDYGVPMPDGKLVAYRWDGEPILSATKFVWMERRETGTSTAGAIK